MGQQLIVEGNDAIVLAGVLKKRGMAAPKGYALKEKFSSEFIRSAGGYQKALTAFREALDNPDLSNIGLVIDANQTGAENRWKAVRQILQEKFSREVVELISLQPEGILIENEDLPRIGIWIMPDNQSTGYLEHFLAKMVPGYDEVWQYAEETLKALESETFCKFTAVKKQKALVHTWLSWQAEPGKPFGQAVEAGYFDTWNPAINSFAHWFERTFELET